MIFFFKTGFYCYVHVSALFVFFCENLFWYVVAVQLCLHNYCEGIWCIQSDGSHFGKGVCRVIDSDGFIVEGC